MKKIFTLIAMAVMAVAAQAQVVFLDPEGKEYTDGQTMTINSTIDPDWGDVVLEPPFIKNTGAASVDVVLNVNITVLPANTAVQECFATNCYFFEEMGSHDTKAVTVGAGEKKSTATEWQCYDSEIDDYAYGTCTIVFTAYENGQKGNTVTVNYVHADEAGINAADNAVKVVKTYDLQGREAAGAKGLVIEKLSNGKVRKVIK